MDLGELNTKLNDCKQQRYEIDRRLNNRNKWISYFTLKREVHFKKLKMFLYNSLLILIMSLLYLPFNLPLAYVLLAASVSVIPFSLYKIYVCNKFTKAINKIELNNQKYIELMNEILEDEHDIDMEIRKLFKHNELLRAQRQLKQSQKEQVCDNLNELGL